MTGWKQQNTTTDIS